MKTKNIGIKPDRVLGRENLSQNVRREKTALIIHNLKLMYKSILEINNVSNDANFINSGGIRFV